MADKSNNLGRAYEYACITVLADKISTIRRVEIIENSSLVANKRAWGKLSSSVHEKLVLSSRSTVNTLFEVEPLILEE